MGNLTGKTEKSGTVGAFDKAGNVDTICILLGDVDPTAEKLYRFLLLLLLSTPPSPVLGDGPSYRTRGLPASLSDQAASKGGT